MAKGDVADPAVVAPAYQLVVAEPFGDYGRGVMITDAVTVQSILDSDNADKVRKITKEA